MLTWLDQSMNSRQHCKNRQQSHCHRFDSGIEDLRGNHIGHAFDLDKFQEVIKDIESETIFTPLRYSLAHPLFEDAPQHIRISVPSLICEYRMTRTWVCP